MPPLDSPSSPPSRRTSSISYRRRKSSTIPFSPHNPHYLSCCQTLHCKTASVLVGVLHFVVGAFLGFTVVRWMLRLREEMLDNVGLIFLAVLYAGCVASIIGASILLLFAVKLEHRQLVQIYITFQVTTTIVIFVIFLLLILGDRRTLFGNFRNPKLSTEEELYIVGEIFATLGVTSIELYFFFVVLKLREFVIDKQTFIGRSTLNSGGANNNNNSTYHHHHHHHHNIARL